MMISFWVLVAVRVPNNIGINHNTERSTVRGESATMKLDLIGLVSRLYEYISRYISIGQFSIVMFLFLIIFVIGIVSLRYERLKQKYLWP